MERLKLKSETTSLRKELTKKKLFKEEKSVTKFISSGSDTLNLAATGDINKGYPLGRFVNIVGDKSTGKSLLGIEACNFVYYMLCLKKKMDVAIAYDDAEFAFDQDLAEKLDMPVKHITWHNSTRIEKFRRNLWNFMDKNHKKDLSLYILDSLDSLSDEDETKRVMDSIKGDKKQDGSFGTGKARGMSEFFRVLNGEISGTNCLLIIISQVRENIGVMFGAKYRRNGGKALDFYASQVIWLREVEQILAGKRKISQGIVVEAKVDKNKVAPPKRKALFNIYYNYGIDNVTSLLDLGLDLGFIEKGEGTTEEDDSLSSKRKRKKKESNILIWNDEEYTREDLIKLIDQDKDAYKDLKKLAQNAWTEIENEARMERRKKYE